MTLHSTCKDIEFSIYGLFDRDIRAIILSVHYKNEAKTNAKAVAKPIKYSKR